jgi:hypothetical protein
MSKKMLLLSSMLLFTLYSCITVKWVPDYSADIEKQLVETQKLNEKMYMDLLAVKIDKRTYETCEKNYLEVESSINSILFQNQARDKNEHMIAITKNLKENFIQFKEEHKSKGTLTDGEIKIYISTINGFWQPLLTAEKALKNIK